MPSTNPSGAELRRCRWTVYSLPGAPVSEHLDLGEAEYALRSAVRSAADALGTIRAEAGGVTSPTRAGSSSRSWSPAGSTAPDHAPSRALRVLENAAHIDAIVTVSSGLMPIGLQTSSEAQIANDALRPLTGVVRSARTGRGQRHPAIGVAAGLAAFGRAERPIDRKAHTAEAASGSVSGLRTG